MLVVGGTYAEHCGTPAWDTTQGSGVRAAGALSASGARLITAVDDELALDAELVSNGIGIRRQLVSRSGPVGFAYFTPLSAPRITGAAATTAGPLDGEDDSVLVFGMLEAVQRRVRARRMLFDPQRPGSRRALDVAGLASDELAIVVNTGEAYAIGGGPDLRVAVAGIFAQSDAGVVVVKGGAAGCWVYTREEPDGQTWVGPCPTASVWPLGSGDTFAAGFAHAWGAGADAVEAARVGSSAAAYWCSTRSPVLPAGLVAGDSDVATALGLAPLAARPQGETPMVYLAGPFFDLGQLWLVNLVRDALAAQGVRVFSPLHDVGPGDDSVAKADIGGLKQCSSVIALLDGSDFGTVYETGWAERAGIPVVGYASRPDREGAKMLTGLGGELHSDLSSAVYRAAWRALGASGPALERLEA